MVLASLSPLLRSVLSSDSWDETITIMLPDLTVQELSTFLTNIYEGSTATASINMELLVLLGLIGPCKPQQTVIARPNKTVIAKTNNTNEDPSALLRKTHRINNR